MTPWHERLKRHDARCALHPCTLSVPSLPTTPRDAAGGGAAEPLSPRFVLGATLLALRCLVGTVFCTAGVFPAAGLLDKAAAALPTAVWVAASKLATPARAPTAASEPFFFFWVFLGGILQLE